MYALALSALWTYHLRKTACGKRKWDWLHSHSFHLHSFNHCYLLLLNIIFLEAGLSSCLHGDGWVSVCLSNPSSPLIVDIMERRLSFLVTNILPKTFNSYSASHENWCTATLWNRIMTAQCEGMGEVESARYEPALLPPCPSIRVLCYSNCQRSTQSHQQSKG